MREQGPGTIEQVLQQNKSLCTVLTPGDIEGTWVTAFEGTAERVPQPFWLYAEDEQAPLILGFPLRVSASWEGFCRELGQLIEAEATYRCSVVLGETANKAHLIEQRTAIVHHLAEILENTLLHDHGRRLSELCWLTLSRETAERLTGAMRAVLSRAPSLPSRVQDEIHYAVAQRIAEAAHRAETEAVGRLRRWGAFDPKPASLVFSKRLRADVLPFAEQRVGRELRELDSYLQGYLRVDAVRFRRLLAEHTTSLERLRERDGSFDRVLALADPEAAAMPPQRLLLARRVLSLLEAWGHPDTPRLSADLSRMLGDLGDLLRRTEVLLCLRRCIFPVEMRGSRAVTQIHGQPARLSAFTRPIDFTVAGVVESAVRRYGLLYDLVEFTQLLEELRRRGRGAEDHAMRFMVRFQQRVDEVFPRFRLKFEKFLGDGAFFSARSARSVLRAAAELRILYERLRRQGFPFDRGLRLAINVGSYHLLPIGASVNDQPHFEFFGHGLVELARLTTGKTTHEVEDIADFLISAGYEVHRVLEFLEPVRHAPRYPENARERPYAAFLVENGELLNLGGVATEAFLRDLEGEWEGLPLAEGERYGLRWLLLPCDASHLEGPWVGLRFLGTARLKGLDPTPISEVVVFEQPPEGIQPLPAGTSLCRTLLQLAGATPEAQAASESAQADEVDPHLCAVSVLEDAITRAWYIGLYDEELDALASAFRVPLSPVDLRDGEPFEAWLFRRRNELGKLYQGLRRDSGGASVALESLRLREGYFTCLLAMPHRSPR